VKIDRTSIQDVGENPSAGRIVGTLLSLFDAFGLAAVAEGIEDEDEAAMLLDLGRPFGQGYLFSRPRPLDQLPSLPAVAVG
jgi:diguanylate cyclase